MAGSPTLPTATTTTTTTATTAAATRLPPLLLLWLLSVAAWMTAVAAPAGPQEEVPPLQFPASQGCWYEGRLRPEGRPVATREPCLNCTCSRGALRCQLRVCAALPDPPPPGCVLLRRRRRCCPALLCDGAAGGNYSIHSEEMPQILDEAVTGQGCAANGTAYAEGSAMASSSLCEYCYCIRGRQRCVRPQCLLPLPGCTPRYMRHSCCPAHYDCSESSATATTTPDTAGQLQGCEYKKKFYIDGDMLHELSNEKCENCFCMKGKIQCVPMACAPPLLGCEPVITQGNCCPSSYNCSITTKMKNTTEHNKNEATTSFAGQDTKENDRSILHNDHLKSGVVDKTFIANTDENKSSQFFEGRSNREMVNNINKSETERHKLLPCNVTIKQNETTPMTTTVSENDETTVETTTEITTTETTTTTTDFTTITSTLPTTTLNSDIYENTTIEDDYTTISEMITNETTEYEVVSDKAMVNESTENNTASEGSVNESHKNDTKIQERIAPTDPSEQVGSTFPDDVITLGPDSDIDIDKAIMTTEQSNRPVTVQTDSTFMTLIPTTVIMPEELDVLNITLHKNVSIVENDNSSTTVNGSLLPVRAIPPEIEAILNITQKKDEDYEYDYNEPSLPPSLPGVRIIPFVAADAVVEDKNSPTVYPKDKHRPTDSPIFYKVSHPNLFSPPVETEGGFIPREPILDGPFYESKFDVSYHTTGINVPSGHMPLDITSGTILPPAITMPPKNEDERCLSSGREYRHGEILAQTDPCLRCICYYGEVLCQATKCPPLKTGCRRLRHKDRRSCCGRIVCGDSNESPTVVLDGGGVGGGGGGGTARPPLLGPIVPPITVADGVVTPDPFRDVIRTEQAPDLPALIGDIMPYLLEQRRTSALPTSATVPAPLTTAVSGMPSTLSTATSATPPSPTTSPSAETPTPSTTARTTADSSSVSHTNPESARPTEPATVATTTADVAASKNDDFDPEEDDSGFSFDSVLQFLFAGDSSTKDPATAAKTERSTTSSTITTAAFITSSATTSTPTTIAPATSMTTTTSESAAAVASTTTIEPATETDNTTMDLSEALNSTQHLLEIFNISLDVSGGAVSGVPPETHSGGNSLGELPADPGAASGLLKLAGCNIYGRMYRVGRIISELSGPCLECMCTEVGVQCRALGC